MGYTPELKELIKKVEATREKRLGQSYPRMSAEEQQMILKKFHPDYKEDAKREVRVGPNKGERMPKELVDLLEAKSRIDPDNFDLSRIEHKTDVLIIGGGGAGATAALFAKDEGVDVTLVTKLRFGYANTMMAEGGVQAATKENDTPARHFLDAIGGGHYENDRELLKILVQNAPFMIKYLEDLGVMWGKEEDGTLKTRHGGGTSRMRMHSAGDMTGAEIMRTLRDEVYNRGINVIEYSASSELILDDEGRCAGAILYNLDTEKFSVILAKTVIIATGGIGRLHIQGFETTNHYGATADGIVISYRAGCRLRFMDSVQYHPTGVVYPEQNVGLLITEKVRGLGAQLVNIDGEQFVYPLEPRDVESSAIIRECVERGKGVKTHTGRVGVWLDSPMIDILHGEGTIERELPAKFRQFQRYNIDIRKEPLLIYPTLHYQNGGIWINARAETDIENLYAAGEVTGGIHGRNRLMGNSLLDILVFGREAGINAARKSKEIKFAKNLSLSHIKEYHKKLKEEGIETDRVSPIFLPDYTRK